MIPSSSISIDKTALKWTQDGYNWVFHTYRPECICPNLALYGSVAFTIKRRKLKDQREARRQTPSYIWLLEVKADRQSMPGNSSSKLHL